MLLILQLTVIDLYLDLSLVVRYRIISHLLSILTIGSFGLFSNVSHVLQHQVVEFNVRGNGRLAPDSS